MVLPISDTVSIEALREEGCFCGGLHHLVPMANVMNTIPACRLNTLVPVHIL